MSPIRHTIVKRRLLSPHSSLLHARARLFPLHHSPSITKTHNTTSSTITTTASSTTTTASTTTTIVLRTMSTNINAKNFQSFAKERIDEEPSVKKSDSEWKESLSELQYHVTRQAGTERPWTGELNVVKDKGKFMCVCCGEELFDSTHKFDSGCGWPSFYAPSQDDKILFVQDRSLGMRRVEVICRNCHAHLGHVFDDAPHTETGLRYCINSASLKFSKENDS